MPWFARPNKLWAGKRSAHLREQERARVAANKLSDSGVAHDNMNVLVMGSQVKVVRAFPLAGLTEEERYVRR